ncbi:uncharacterized protein UBRO_05993 [Ustilago bromivora]|uniref:Uncharacterized protein n=1 Tax=Ustilago bromivora TaxID=307758 RepID=A0A1K0HCS0_9BASI|nr:uncharacterized protein UBRO_05993 [Ustilago bromivora]SYW75778.1 uncharacterized protein UBRO2_00933 [Ustilago bromivora]
MFGRRKSLTKASRIRARKRSAKIRPSFLLRHYTLFNSLTRYTHPCPPRSTSSKRTPCSYTAQSCRTKASRLQERYAIGGIWSYSWPKPFPQLPATAQEPHRVVEELVAQIVKDTFDAEYTKFRSPKWASEHRITKEHLEKIVVDQKEVKESAEAAKMLVNTALNRFFVGVKKGAVGKSTRSHKAMRQGSMAPSSPHAQPLAAPTAETTAMEDAGTLEDLDAELQGELWEDGERYTLECKGLLDYMQSTAGSSKTAQWRNWHLLDAVKKTRERCEELFGHEDR